MAGNRLTKSDFVNTLAEKTGLNKRQVNSVLEAMSSVASEQLGASGPGEVTIPGLVKLVRSVKPATPERPGTNPFTKEPTIIKAKPERRVVKARPVKALKDAV